MAATGMAGTLHGKQVIVTLLNSNRVRSTDCTQLTLKPRTWPPRAVLMPASCAI